jgi:hypothetical protein
MLGRHHRPIGAAMPKMVKFTEKGSNSIVFVNPSLVHLVIEALGSEGSDIVFDGSHKVTVIEKPDDVARKLNGAR